MAKRPSPKTAWQSIPAILSLLLVCLLAGCAAEIGDSASTPASDCLTPLPDEEISALYPTEDELWPLEDCQEAYAAARRLSSVGHVRLAEVSEILSIELIQAREVPGLNQPGDEPAWQVELRGRLAFDPPPMPADSPSPTNTPSGPEYGCMRVTVMANTPNYGSVRTIDCPPHPDLPTPAPF